MFGVQVRYRPNGRGPWVERLLELDGETRTWDSREVVEHYVHAVNAMGGQAKVVQLWSDLVETV